MKTRPILTTLVGLLLMAGGLLPAPAIAQQMNYQGRLTDANGSALQDGQYTLTFDLYDAATGGTKVWGPFQCDGLSGDGHGPKADVVNGRFNVILGANDATARALSGAFGGARYLQITVAANPPILPRQQILSAPEALHAINADHATIADGISGSLNITGNLNGGGDATFVGKITAPNIFSGNVDATGNINVAGTMTAAGAINAQNSINFGSSTRQMLNLYGVAYGIGVQANTEYFRTATGFAWFRGGAHNDSQNNPGLNGKTIMTLDTNGLTINGEPYSTANFQNTSKGPRASHVHWGATGDWIIRSAAVAGNVYIQDNGGNVVTGGYVGIGGAPDYPLHVRASRAASLNVQVGDLRNYDGGIWQHISDPLTPYSIVADQIVLATGFQATSDRRIKKVIGISDTVKDLATVQKLAVTEYHFVDRETKGGKLQKGFIAQEVQAIIPEAVSASANFIPDIFSHASAVSYDKNLKSLAISLPKAHQLKVGDRVRLVAGASELDLAVESVPSDREFVVSKCERDPGQVFVYGKYVTDLLNVNYDRIFTTGIGAIQELAKHVKALEESQSHLAELEQKAGRVEALEREVADLRTLVNNIAQVQGGRKQTAQSGDTTVSVGLVARRGIE